MGLERGYIDFDTSYMNDSYKREDRMKTWERRLAKLESSGIFLRRPRYFLGRFRLFADQKPQPAIIAAGDEIASETGAIEPIAPEGSNEVGRSHVPPQLRDNGAS